MIIRPKNSRRYFAIVPAVLIFIITISGCWDQIEIEQRSFVLGIGIDMLPARELKPAQIMEPGVLREQLDQILVTLEIPKTTQLGTDQNQGYRNGGSDDQSKPAWTPSITGVNISQAISEIQIRSNNQIFMGHLRLIAVGDDLARKKGLHDILAFFFRDVEIQRNIPFFIVNGQAKDLLALIPPDEKMAALYMNNITSVENFSARLFYDSIGNLATDLYEDGNALIGRVRPASTDAVSGGIAVIKDWKLAGFLSEVETLGANLLLKRINRDIITVQLDKSNWYSVRIYNVRQKVKPRWNGHELQLRYHFSSEGEIAEVPKERMITKNKNAIPRLEKLVAQQLKAAVESALMKLQHEYRTDAIGLGIYLRKHYPQIWKQVGPRWLEEFPRMKVDIRVEHKLRRMGVSL